MNFEKVLAAVCQRLDAVRIRYALIGGFAMALRGVQRATMDLDFILLLDDLQSANAILEDLGYRRQFHSKNVSHYLAAASEWGRIDILHAFRGPTLGMLDRAERLQVTKDLRLPVVHREDLIGLKVQAGANDPTRAVGDWDDIRLLIEAARVQGVALDWKLIEDYLRLFGLESKLAQLKAIYG